LRDLKWLRAEDREIGGGAVYDTDEEGVGKFREVLRVKTAGY
jgi:hypothetical protein